jgi:putative FmdB family regulatory protein
VPIYDYECQNCGHLELDVYASVHQEETTCSQCQGPSSRIISLSGVHTANEGADWIRSVTEIVDKDDKSRVSQEFLKSPTRTNLKRFMDAKGLRHLENQHGGPPPAFDRSKQEVPKEKIEKAVWERHRKRNTLHVR